MIAIVDLGAGNLRSVENGLAAVGGEGVVASVPSDLAEAAGIVLPGVGAFGPAMDRLRNDGWAAALEKEVRGRGKPFLGICLGMQLIATRSEEFGVHDGLGWIDATVSRLQGSGSGSDCGVRVPHIGWNDVSFAAAGEGLAEGLPDEETFYFVHSYAVTKDGAPFIKGRTHYGTEFVSCVEDGNVWATQFHPEKSQRPGLQILSNFVGRCA